jgi:hypothetical protein
MSFQEQNPTFYPGRGLQLRHVASATGDLSDQAVVIPTGEYSEVFQGGGCVAWSLEFVIDNGASTTGDVLIQQCDDQHAANNGQLFDTVSFASENVKSWPSGGPLPGFFRVKNTSGASIRAYLQKQIM